MNAHRGAMTDEAAEHHRVAGGALAFVGSLGIAHAAWFAWSNQPSYIETPAIAVISATLLLVAAWMSTVKPA